jgi:hypothetical protein
MYSLSAHGERFIGSPSTPEAFAAQNRQWAQIRQDFAGFDRFAELRDGIYQQVT